MNPIIMRELLEVRRVLTTRYATWEDNYDRGMLLLDAGVPREKDDSVDAVTVLKATLPHRRFNEECEREYDAARAAGGRTICPACGQRSVVHSTVCTYGIPGHAGSEFSDYGRCENCDHAEL
jgi:hypothetical protein